jgi:hypothetical protein
MSPRIRRREYNKLMANANSSGRRFPFMLAALVVLPTALFAAGSSGFSIRVSAGGLFLTNPEWLGAVAARDAEQKQNYLGDFAYTIQSNYGYGTFVPGFAAEAAVKLSPRLSLTLSVGYNRQSWSLGGTYDSRLLQGSEPWAFSATTAYRLRLIPLTMALRCAVADSPRLRIEIESGAGVYFASLDYDRTQEHGFYSPWAKAQMRFIETETCRDGARSDLGFNFGVRADWAVARGIGLGVEAAVQVVPLGNMRGTLESRYQQYENAALIIATKSLIPDSLLTNGGTSLSGILLRAVLRLGSV